MSDEADSRPICTAKAIIGTRGFFYPTHVVPTIIKRFRVPLLRLPETYLRLFQPMRMAAVTRGISMIRRQHQIPSRR